KIELNRFEKEQRLAGVKTLNLANLVVDTSCLSDALGYEFFRESGIPAPRTAYSYLTLSVEGKMAAKPLGLYLLIEDVDSQFAAERFAGKKAAIFKPVTYDLFKDLGADWAAYVQIYDPKNKPTP